MCNRHADACQHLLENIKHMWQGILKRVQDDVPGDDGLEKNIWLAL